MPQPSPTLDRQLIQAFMLFSKTDWHQYSIAGCKHSEIRVLMCLKHAPRDNPLGLHVSEISQRLHVTSSSITQLLNGLEAQGLIARHAAPDDRRAIFVRLTADGEAVAHQAARTLHEAFHGLITFLGEAESAQLADLLQRVYRYFHPNGAEHPPFLAHGEEV